MIHVKRNGKCMSIMSEGEITENEEEAFDELLSIVNFEVENNRYI